MSDLKHPLIAPPPPELQQRVSAVARRLGIRPAAQALGLSREATLGIIAGWPTRHATVALAESRIAALEQAA